MTVKVNRNPPWLTHDLLAAIRSRNILYRRAHKTGKEAHLDCYRKKRNEVANMLKSAKFKFFEQLDPSNPKVFWKTTKYLNSQKSTIPVLKDAHGQPVSDDSGKAALLNEFFAKCFNTSIPKLEDWTTVDFDLDPSYCPEEFLCDEEEVLDLLLSLDTTKANGSDGISATMLKSTVYSIAPQITKLFNKSIMSGKLPSSWKLSSVVPVPKGNDNTNVANYRPISLLPIISKLLERHMYWVIAKHFELHSPISIYQWGFQPRKSTTAALLNVYNDWSAALDRGKEVCAIFFDLRKAFDSVPHRCLIDKLTLAGLDPYILRWLISYLCNRRQYVVLNGKASLTTYVESGVPQGSVLGPLLFLFYINDSVQEPLSDGTLISLYADDILMYRIIHSTRDYEALQEDTDTVSSWVDSNDLALNSIKCKYMVVSRLKSRSVPSQTMLLYNQPMEQVSNYKYLGVILTNDLSWSLHIDKIACKTRRLVGFLYRKFYRWATSRALIRLYLCLIRPHLEYAVSVWNPYLKKDEQKLESIQKFALKICLKSWDRSYSDNLQACNLPSLADRRKMLCLVYLYKAINGYVVTPNNAPLEPRICSYNTRSNSRKTYIQPYAHSNLYFHSFYPSTLSLWNSLPHVQSITTSPSIPSFKRNLKHYFSSKSFT